jgi:hypothetical protein
LPPIRTGIHPPIPPGRSVNASEQQLAGFGGR